MLQHLHHKPKTKKQGMDRNLLWRPVCPAAGKSILFLALKLYLTAKSKSVREFQSLPENPLVFGKHSGGNKQQIAIQKYLNLQ